MNQLVGLKSFLSVDEALELANTKSAEDDERAERLTLYELAQLGDLPLSIKTDSGILDFLHTDKACKVYLQYLCTHDPITLNARAGNSIEVVMGADSDSNLPNLKQPYTFKDSQSGEEVELPEFPNGVIGFRSKPLNALIDGNANSKSESPAPDVNGGDVGKPWLTHNPNDPIPKLAWYTPARYFAREFIKEDVTLLTNRHRLTHKIAETLPRVNVYKRGGKIPLDAETIKKALTNINFG